MQIIRMLDDKDLIIKASESLFDNEDSNFSLQDVDKQNSAIEEKNNKLGTLALKYRKKGVLILIAVISVFMISSLLSHINFFFAALFSLLTTVSIIAIVLWVITWFAYWLAPLKHCTFCNGLYCREVVFEKEVPGFDVETTATRIVSKNIKDAKGNKIGSIDENVKVNVRRIGYYTVFRCKKCGKFKVEIIVKEIEI